MAASALSPRRRPILAAAVLILIGLGLFVTISLASGAGQGIVAQLVSRALSSPTSKVTVGAIDGLLSPDLTIRDISVADPDGAWLKVDRVHVLWRPLALFRLRLAIDTLDIDRVEVIRKPVSDDKSATGAATFRLPQLPLDIEVAHFAIPSSNLGASVLGNPVRFSAKGSAHLGSRGLGLVLDLERQDRPGTLATHLDFVPESKALRVSLHLDEPAGGILAETFDLRDRPPVQLAFDGDGTLDAFRGTLAFAAGPTIDADGTLSLDRAGQARRLGLDLAGRVAGLLPDMLAPVFAERTKLTGAISFADDGSIAIPDLALAAAAARIDVKGRLAADRAADIEISGTNIANTEKGTTVLEGVTIERFALDARLRGPLDAPSIDGALTVGPTRLPSLGLDGMTAKFTAVPRDMPDHAGVLNLGAEVEAKGLSLGDAALGEAIGKNFRLTLRGTGKITGPIDVETLRIASPNVSADFTGVLGSDNLKGRLVAEAPDLARFGRLAGLPLQGEVTFAAEVEGGPAARRFAATIDAAARKLASGIAQIDGLTGGEARLTGGASYDPENGFRAETLSLTGLHASARLDGSVTPKAADITALMTIPSLEKADKRLAGRGEATAHVTGTAQHPDATLTARISDGALLGRAVPSLGLEASVTDLLGDFAAKAHLDGTVGGKLARGSVQAVRLPNGETRLDPLDIRIGSVVVTGSGTIDTAYLAAGNLSVHARDLDDLSPLLLEKLSGTVDAELTFTRDGARQDLALEAKGQKIAGFGMGLDRLSAGLSATDLYRRPALSGSLEALEVRIGSETIARLRLEAKGAPAASEVILTASARGIDLDARGRVTSDPVRIDLTKLDARRGRTRIGLAGPATVTIGEGGADIRNLALTMNGGRLSVEGRAGTMSDLKVTARAVPLSVAALAAPDLGLSGTLDGEVTIAGPLQSPTGAYRLRIANVVAPQTRSAGLPPIAAEAKGRLDGAQATLDATISAGAAGRLAMIGNIPLAGGAALDLALKGNFDAGVAGRTLAAAGRRVTGQVAVDGRVTGTLDRPKASGSAVLSNGSYQDANSGTRLNAVHARLVARDDKITIENASATTRNGGAITLSGDIQLDPAGGFPGSLEVGGQRAEIVRSSLATAIVDLDLTITGPLARYPRLGGKVGIETLDIAIPDQLLGAVQPLPGTRHIQPTPTARERLELAARNERQNRAAPFNAELDVTVDVPGRIRVTGRGLDAELGGSLKVLGTLAEPKPVGAFNLVKGNMRILTTQLDFTRANLTFAGDLSPQLDFLATTQAGGASIRIAVTGHPSDPQFAFSSSPDYPQDEILSRLLFGQGSGRLTPTQALALTQVVAIYSGGTSALESLRRSLGLGGSSPSSNPLTNWLGDRVSMGIRTGATPAQTGVGVDISIWKQLKARGAIDARGAASVGVGAEYEW